jgi:hypothetical protein
MKTRIPLDTDPMVIEGIKDLEKTRKTSVTTIVFVVFIVGIALMVMAYFYGYFTTGTPQIR